MLLHSALYSFYSPHSEHMSQSIYCKAEINRDLVTRVFLVLRAVRLFSRRHQLLGIISLVLIGYCTKLPFQFCL